MLLLCTNCLSAIYGWNIKYKNTLILGFVPSVVDVLILQSVLRLSVLTQVSAIEGFDFIANMTHQVMFGIE